MMRWFVLLFLLSTNILGWADDDVLQSFQQAYAEAMERYQDQDMEGFLEASQAAIDYLPHHHGANWNAAVAAVGSDQPDRAWRHLNTLAEMGLVFPFWSSAHFADHLEKENWPALRSRMEANLAERGPDSVVFDLGAEPRFIEDVIELDGMWLASSIHHRGLFRIDDGAWQPYLPAVMDWWSPMALVILDAWLIVTHSALPQGKDTPAEALGRAGVVAIDWRGHSVADQARLDDGQHLLGEAIVVDDRVWMTDSADGAILSWRPGGELQVELPAGSLPNPQGLVFDPRHRRMVVADYFLGLVWFDLDQRRVRPLTSERPLATVGVDGLYLRENTLIAIQNGIQPQRIVAWTLSDDGRQIINETVLAAARSDWIEPTLGLIKQDRLIFVAGAQWPNFTAQHQPQGPYAPVLIKQLALPAKASVQILE